MTRSDVDALICRKDETDEIEKNQHSNCMWTFSAYAFHSFSRLLAIQDPSTQGFLIVDWALFPGMQA